MKEELETIGAAVGCIPSGCSILTVEHEGCSTGILVSWVQQAAFTPPSITVCIKQGRPICPLIEGSNRFLLNVIGEDPSFLFKHFGKGFPLEEDAFEGLTVRETAFGPAIETCIAHLGCQVVEIVPVGDHKLYAARVEAAGVVDNAIAYVHLRKNGLTY